MNQKYPSVLLENAVNELSSLPGPLYMFLEMTVIFYARKLPAITKKCYLCIKKKELFESMRNIVILNSLEFSYPLPVLMRVFYKALIIK